MSKKTTHYVVACAILMCLCNSTVAQTKSIKGVINQYARVTHIDRATKSVTLDDASMFHQAALQDTVLLIQMTGISEIGNGEGQAGIYEFHIVTHKVGATVTLKAPPGEFDTNELVQMIRIPSYKNADIDSTLTCKEWLWKDGTGGVLALMVEGTLTFNADIDVSGLGFQGGKASDTEYIGNCSFRAEDETDFLDYQEASNFSGYKGEGAVTINFFNPNDPTSHLKGYRPAWNGGGGGNGKWSGGGGGSNSSFGGYAGDQSCREFGFAINPEAPNGNGGRPFKYPELIALEKSIRLFMGGGGGSGTGKSSPGGNGGGIVIIVAQNLQFNTNTSTGAPSVIKANGGSVDQLISEGGAGGGGAGGAIFLSVKDYGDIRAQITGGDGGSVYRKNCDNDDFSMGAGGGGSGGYMQISNNVAQLVNWTNNGRLRLNGGAGGEVIIDGIDGCQFATGRGLGSYCGDAQIQLRGFLNNYLIFNSDSVCYDKKIIIQASQPIIWENEWFDYFWESSSDGKKWILAYEKNTPDLTEIECSFTEDTYLRRKIVTATTGIIDSSSYIKINVRSAIEDNIISPKETTICWDEKGFEIVGNIPKNGGGGEPYIFLWQEYKNNDWINFDNESGNNLTIELIPSGDQIIRRQAISGKGCVSGFTTSLIHTQPEIIENSISPEEQNVCENTADMFIGSTPKGGTGNYRYQWQISSFNRKDWNDITGDNANEPDYIPKFMIHKVMDSDFYYESYYRRMVTSDQCNSLSNKVKVRFYLQSSPSVIESASKDVFFKHYEELYATPPDVGAGTWWSNNNDLEFTHRNQPVTTVEKLANDSNTIYWSVNNGTCFSDTASLIITVKDIDFIPSRILGFSPNKDEFNDCFTIRGVENASTIELTIIDRYNNVVFKNYLDCSNNNCTCLWDGTRSSNTKSSSEQLPAGTYYYQLILNRDKVYKGYVVLKR